MYPEAPEQTMLNRQQQGGSRKRHNILRRHGHLQAAREEKTFRKKFRNDVMKLKIGIQTHEMMRFTAARE